MDIWKLSEWQADRVYQRGIEEATQRMNAEFRREWYERVDEIKQAHLARFKTMFDKIDEKYGDIT